MSADLELSRKTAKRLERYAVQSREKIWKQDFIGALADLAETGEIARRLYLQVQNFLKQPAASAQSADPRTPGHG